jgi:hypothetical protein
MKRFGIMAILAVLVMTVMTTIAHSQPWKGWKGSGGWGYKSQYQRIYNPQTVTTIKGIVEAVEQIIPRGGMSYGIHLKVKIDEETLSVHLGPAWFIERQDIKIEKDDIIEVKGSKITYDGAPSIIAAEVKKGDTVLRLRDENGFPAWAGMGMGRMRR